jgi:ribonuclease P protein component
LRRQHSSTRKCAETLTSHGRSGRLPRHEADLSTEEAAQEPHARLPEAIEHAGRAQRVEASQGEGAQAPHLKRAEEVAGRVKLEKAARLRRRREFLEVQQRGRRVYSGDVLVLALGSGASRPRIGITVSSKVGNAVERNRVKRWVREAWRPLRTDLPALDLVVIARPAAKTMGLEGARRALEAARDALLASGGMV